MEVVGVVVGIVIVVIVGVEIVAYFVTGGGEDG